jgi:DNA-binding transcriptional MerR regulator
MWVSRGADLGESRRAFVEGFTSHQACRLTGCTPRQLRYWDQIGLVKPGVRQTGGRPGVPRLYSFRDLIALKVVKSLLDGGMSLQRVRRAYEYLRREEHLQGGSAGGGDPRRPPGRADGVLRGHRQHRPFRGRRRHGVPARPGAVRPGASGCHPAGQGRGLGGSGGSSSPGARKRRARRRAVPRLEGQRRAERSQDPALHPRAPTEVPDHHP